MYLGSRSFWGAIACCSKARRTKLKADTSLLILERARQEGSKRTMPNKAKGEIYRRQWYGCNSRHKKVYRKQKELDNVVPAHSMQRGAHRRQSCMGTAEKENDDVSETKYLPYFAGHRKSGHIGVCPRDTYTKSSSTNKLQHTYNMQKEKEENHLKMPQGWKRTSFFCETKEEREEKGWQYEHTFNALKANTDSQR